MCLGNGRLLLSLGVWYQSVGPCGQALFVLKTRPILVLLSDKILHIVAEVDILLQTLSCFSDVHFKDQDSGDRSDWMNPV
ncbi:MAG: hypothetical protein CMJ81_15435 [Planctomycetaceae bacterium]|nr:hypothetical protein [Planctomycetaceae bacterium]